MNDCAEVSHGLSAIMGCLTAEDHSITKRLVSIFDRIAPRAAGTAVQKFLEWRPHLLTDTYIGCLSMHSHENQTGRLSMWRAYAPAGDGVAISMSPRPFTATTSVLGAFSTPVIYLDEAGLAPFLHHSLSAIEDASGSFKGMSELAVAHVVFNWLVFLSVGLKHPAFEEEHEFRVIRIPSMWSTSCIESAPESIRGVAQVVQKIPLLNDPERGLDGADIPNLIQEILIGPSNYPAVIADALACALERHGVSEPRTRIRFSRIPLRV